MNGSRVIFRLQIKEVAPIKSLRSPLARFWTEDVKIAREFVPPTDGSLGEDFVREWAVSLQSSVSQSCVHLFKRLFLQSSGENGAG